MKRKLAWGTIGCLTLFVSGGAILYFTRPEPDAISPANCARIKKGMRKDEVVAILGGLSSFGPMPNGIEVWEGKSGIICIQFDGQAEIADSLDPPGLVAQAHYSPRETSFLDKLRTWLGW